jgi:hypothetical protein
MIEQTSSPWTQSNHPTLTSSNDIEGMILMAFDELAIFRKLLEACDVLDGASMLPVIQSE